MTNGEFILTVVLGTYLGSFSGSYLFFRFSPKWKQQVKEIIK